MEFTVQNNSLLYSVSFTEETARISIRDLSNGFYESFVTLPITVWHIIEHQRQQFVYIIRDRFQSRRISLELAEWVTKLCDQWTSLSSRKWNRFSRQLRCWKHSVHISVGGKAGSQQLVQYTRDKSSIQSRAAKQPSPDSEQCWKQ